jgi:hypothetical protein
METRDPRACTTEQAQPQPVEPDTREAAHRYHAPLAVSSSEGARVCGIPHLLVRTRFRGGHPQDRGGDHPNVRLPLTGYTFSLAFCVLTPVVILVLVSAAFYSVNLDWLVSDIWLVSVYYFGVRVVFNGVTEWCLLPN